MYFYLKGLPFEVETIGISQVDSAANTVFLAGATRKALTGCRFFWHDGTFNIGQPSAPIQSHRETLKVLEELLNRNVEILARETGKTSELVKEVMSKGNIFNIEEAITFGLATETITQLPTTPNAPQQ